MRKISLFGVAVATFLASVSSFAYVAVESSDGYDCKITCLEAGWIVRPTDSYKGGPDSFYMCMANVNGEGYRGGYSLSHQQGCQVVVDGQAKTAVPFTCMCG